MIPCRTVFPHEIEFSCRPLPLRSGGEAPCGIWSEELLEPLPVPA